MRKMYWWLGLLHESSEKWKVRPIGWKPAFVQKAGFTLVR